MSRATLCVRCDEHPATRIWREQAVCNDCYRYFDNYDGDPDGNAIFRDREAEYREQQYEARRLK
jgi:hypothetical protein